MLFRSAPIVADSLLPAGTGGDIADLVLLAHEQPVLNSEYTDRVILELLIPFQDVDEVQKAITESTNGRAKMEKDREMYFAVLDGEVLTFEE